MPTADERGISTFLVSAIPRLHLEPGAKVLDAPTGLGRHAHWLSGDGFSVVAADLDAARIEAAKKNTPRSSRAIQWTVADLEQENPALFDGSFDLMVCVHYFSEGIVTQAWKALKPGGIFLLETFGGQGQNWRSLPRPGWFALASSGRFEIKSLRETTVGPSKGNVALKLIARRL